MRIAIANDHAGLSLKPVILDELKRADIEVTDFGADDPQSVDYPDFAALVGRAVQRGDVERGILICGSGVGMCIAVNKLHGIRASVAHDTYSAHQGVEHDGMNVLCLGSRIVGEEVAREIVRAFVNAEFWQEERYQRRLDKVKKLEASPEA